MPDRTQPLDLSSLNDDFEIVGELDARGSARAFRATRRDTSSKRRDDETGVLIEVVSVPDGDEGDALAHLAADTQLLTRLRHRRLIPVLEGRWIGTGAFAVVTPRIGDPSLAQMLEKGEPFSSPRTAAILREVNGLLAWAREQKIVHRSVTPARLFLEPRTDRVRVSFAVAPITRIQTSDSADADARTIGKLAMAMLTGSADPQSVEGESLGELRPDLPEQVVLATAGLVEGKTPGADVAGYIALVGMSEPLLAGETEAERIRAEVLEEQRVEREKLAAERAEFERTMEEERQKLSMERDTLQKKVADEREMLQRKVAAEQEEMQRMMAEERETLQRKDVEERAALVAKREALEREAADRRAELERAAERDRRQLAELRVAIEKAGELEVEKKRVTALDDITDTESVLAWEELATPGLALPASVPLQPLEFEPLTYEPLTFTPLTFDDDSAATTDEESDEAPKRRNWILPGALAAAALVVVAVLVMLGRPTSATLTGTPAARPIVPAASVTAPPTSAVPLPVASHADSPAVALPAATHVDSSGGALPVASRVGSSTGGNAPALHSGAVIVPVVKRRPNPVVIDTAVQRDPMLLDETPARREPAPRRETRVRRDTMVRRDTASASVRDILSRVPGAAVTRPDAPPSRDSGGRPDTATVPPEYPPI